MNTTIQPGLVFAIPLAAETYGFGQLVAHQQPIFYMVAYDIKAASQEPHTPTIARVMPRK
jgi:hypothetical protein